MGSILGSEGDHRDEGKIAEDIDEQEHHGEWSQTLLLCNVALDVRTFRIRFQTRD